MANNTESKRNQLAQQILAEIKHGSKDDYYKVGMYLREVLTQLWKSDDDAWNHATDVVFGNINGEPFGGE